jgi:hypothetical protein
MTAFSENENIFISIIHRIIGMINVFIPFTIDGIINKGTGGKFLMPSVEDIKVFTFNELSENIETVKKIVKKGKKTFSKRNMDALLQDLPRHNSFRYIKEVLLMNILNQYIGHWMI